MGVAGKLPNRSPVSLPVPAGQAPAVRYLLARGVLP